MVIAVDDGVLPEVRAEERIRLDVDRVRRMRGGLAPVEGRRHQLAPFVPLRPGVIGAAFGELLEVAVQAAPERHVEDLAPPADREQGDAAVDRESRVRQLDLVQERRGVTLETVRIRATVPVGLDVPPAGQHEGVHPLHERDPVVLVLVVRQEDGQRPGSEQRPAVPEPVVVAVVGEALRDRDDRALLAHVRVPTIVSNQLPNNARPWSSISGPRVRSSSISGGSDPGPRTRSRYSA